MSDNGATETDRSRAARLKAFSSNLYRLMLANGMTQSDLARAAKMGRDSVNGYVNGKNLPSEAKARALAGALGVPVAKLYEGLADLTEEMSKQQFDLAPVPGRTDRLWIHVSRVVPFDVAAQIAELLKEAEKRLKREDAAERKQRT